MFLFSFFVTKKNMSLSTEMFVLLSLMVLLVCFKYFAKEKLLWLMYISVNPCVGNNLFFGEQRTNDGSNNWVPAFIFNLLLCQSRAAFRNCMCKSSWHARISKTCKRWFHLLLNSLLCKN